MGFEPEKCGACVCSVIVDRLLCTGSVPDTPGDAQMSHRWSCPQRAHGSHKENKTLVSTTVEQGTEAVERCSLNAVGVERKENYFHPRRGPLSYFFLGGGRLGGKGGGTS